MFSPTKRIFFYELFLSFFICITSQKVFAQSFASITQQILKTKSLEVIIDGKKHSLKKETSCIRLFGPVNDLDNNTCQCCLLVDLIFSDNDDKTIIESCKRRKLCQDKHVEEIKSVDFLGIEKETEKLNRLAKETNAPRIPDLSHFTFSSSTDLNHFLEGERLSPEALPILLKELADFKLLEGTSIPQDFIVKELGKGGRNSGQIFLIFEKEEDGSRGKGLFVLKEVKSGKIELQNLHYVKQVVVQKTLNDSKSPRITKDIFNFKVKKSGLPEEKRFFSLLEMAEGKDLASYITEYGKKENPTEQDKYDMQQIFYELGSQMNHLYDDTATALSHLNEGYSHVHGDFHPSNIYVNVKSQEDYNPKRIIISLIDNETFAINSRYPQKGSKRIKDFSDLFAATSLKTVATNSSNGQHFLFDVDKNISSDDWFSFWKEAIRGLVDQYHTVGSTRRLEILDKLEKEFFEELSSLAFMESLQSLGDQRKLKLMDIDPARRKRILKDLREKVFDSLREDFVEFNKKYSKHPSIKEEFELAPPEDWHFDGIPEVFSH